MTTLLRSPTTVLSLVISVLAFAACGGTTKPDPEEVTVSFSVDVQPIFTVNCASSDCHFPPSPQRGMDLSAGSAFTNIVGVTSVELPTMFRISAGQPDQSYLVHKIQGTHLDVGGNGERMPLNRNPLSAANITTIRDWVSQGARNN